MGRLAGYVDNIERTVAVIAAMKRQEIERPAEYYDPGTPTQGDMWARLGEHREAETAARAALVDRVHAELTARRPGKGRRREAP